jgi:hypothetical protein
MDKNRNPNSALSHMMPKPLCFKDVKKFNYLFICFWFGLLFCKLLWSGFGELVSMIEHDLSCSMDNIYEQCESQFLGMIGAKFSRVRRDVDNGKLYEAG